LPKHPSLVGRERAYKLVFLQALVMVSISILCFVCWGEWLALSALCGGVVAVVPNFVFATLAFSRPRGRAGGNPVQAFYRGEAIKLMLTILLFGLSFAVVKANAPALFGCYIVTQMVHWIAPLLFQRKQLG